MSGSLRTTHAMGWQEEPWILDPAALDGGLQLAVLWFKRHLGGASLPLSVGSLNTFPLAAPTETLHAVLRSRPKGEHQTVSDLTFADENGTVVLELSGVEIFRRPNASVGDPAAGDPAAGDPAAGEGAGA